MKSIKTIQQVNPGVFTPEIFREIECIFHKIREKMRIMIPVRTTVCKFTNELKEARIATSDELEHLLFSCSLGRFMVKVDLHQHGDLPNSPWFMDGHFCVLLPAEGYVSMYQVSVNICDAIGDMNPVMTAQSHAIRNVLRQAGFRAEHDAEDAVDAVSKTTTEAVVHQSVDESSNIDVLIDSKQPRMSGSKKTEQTQQLVDAKQEIPSTWTVPSSIDVEHIRNLMAMSSSKPIDYTDILMNAMKVVREQNPALKKLKWSYLFERGIDHKDPPTRLSGLSTVEMEKMTNYLLQFKTLKG